LKKNNMGQLNLGVVKDAKILTAQRDRKKKRTIGLNGLVITFETDEVITHRSVVEILFNGNLYPFNVKEIEISEDKKLIGTAVECGYWAKLLSKREDLDLRVLLDLKVELVKDSTKLKQIAEESCWC